ncbi:MAG: methyltransferase domain-containing protein [Microgenomates group bacterium]
METLGAHEIAHYENIFRTTLVADARSMYGRYSTEAILALASVPRHQFFTQNMLRRIKQSGQDPIQAARNPMGPFYLDDNSLMALPPMSAGFISAAGIRSGFRVLEIGTGSGYNAALLASAVGKTGHVTTLETNEYLADHARAALFRTGFNNVEVLNRDGRQNLPHEAPYDAIMIDGLAGIDVRPLIPQLQLGGRMIACIPRWRDAVGRDIVEPLVVIERVTPGDITVDILVNFKNL